MPDEPEEVSEAELARRSRWFEWYTDTQINNSVRQPERDRPYACPCCGYLTLDSRGGYEICEVCFWEDDGQDDHDADLVRGGPNGALSLTKARRNFAEFGACERRMLRNVRAPRPDEHPLGDQS
ncbi:CPCC family cysteine-rich protein [Spirillospora sp. CA-294931]|uniref:CPCC family cysteine-rich protein n=1 Tax=Spirillospora sp. CA-294931 TaxID=3240042 RepID=UPI003D8BE9A2